MQWLWFFSNQAAINSVVWCMSVCIHKLRAGQTRCWFVGLQELYLVTWKICTASFANHGGSAFDSVPFFRGEFPAIEFFFEAFARRDGRSKKGGPWWSFGWPHLSNVAGRGLKVSWKNWTDGGGILQGFFACWEPTPSDVPSLTLKSNSLLVYHATRKGPDLITSKTKITNEQVLQCGNVESRLVNLGVPFRIHLSMQHSPWELRLELLRRIGPRFL